MYRPKHFEQSDAGKLSTLIAQNPFGTLVTLAAERPFASHIPFLHDAQDALLLGHVARANPQWQHFQGDRQVLTIFQGPHAYISPTWYVDPGVPTWNYAVAHVYGTARAIEDSAQVRKIVERLTAREESRFETPWVPRYDPRMLQAIVGIEIRISEIQGKFKLGQNRSAADRAAVKARLGDSGSENGIALAKLMEDL